MKSISPIAILPANNILGEGILWDSRREALWWTDIHGLKLHRYSVASDTMETLPSPERIGSFGLIGGDERLITAFASGIAIYDARTQQVEWLSKPTLAAGTRFNDGRIDRQGRFWSGTMIENAEAGAEACLFCLSHDRDLSIRIRNITIANGLCFSPDGRHMYFTDSPTQLIQVFEVLEPGGAISAPRPFARTTHGAYPDGATVDADGCVWSAHWGAGCVVRYTPSGEIDQIIRLPTAQPSCVCFGGTDLDILCVTTARAGLDAAVLSEEPNAGDVFLFRPGAQGLPECEYRR